MNKLPRCINLDWLEVYALEPVSFPHTMDWFREQGFGVADRGYGTRIYEEMFTLIGADDYPFIEVRRNPKNNSILPINATHLRFVNRRCYVENAAEVMQQFLDQYGYQFVSVSRVDICMDFEKFDYGDLPEKFVKRYIGHKYAKINQSDASARFEDQWAVRDFNSLSWGSKNSDIGTKLYNKTLELYDEKKGSFNKPYILQAWFESRLIDDPIRCLKINTDGTTYRPQIWRLEFSIKSNVKGWFSYRIDGDSKKIRSVRNTLATYYHRQLLVPIFDLLQQHYFHFKKYQKGRSKYDCKDKLLFDFSTDEVFYKVEKPASPKKPDALILRLRRYLHEYLNLHLDPSVQKAGNIILDKIEREDGARFCSNIYSQQEYEALKRVIAARMAGDNRDPTLIADDIIHLLQSKEIF